MSHFPRTLPLSLILASLAACSSTAERQLDVEPRVRVLESDVLDGAIGEPERLSMVIEVDNPRDEPLALDPRSPSFYALDGATVEPGARESVPAGATRRFRMVVEMPEVVVGRDAPQ